LEALETLDPFRQELHNLILPNKCVLVTETMLHSVFSSCGDIEFVKMAGDNAQGVRYAFIEFKAIDSAVTAQGLTGTVIGDRPIKVGKADNPIVRPVDKDPNKLKEALRRVRMAQEKIGKRLGTETSEKKRSRSRSRSREPRGGRTKYSRRSSSRDSRDREHSRRSSSREKNRRKKKSRSRS